MNIILYFVIIFYLGFQCRTVLAIAGEDFSVIASDTLFFRGSRRHFVRGRCRVMALSVQEFLFHSIYLAALIHGTHVLPVLA